MAVRSPAPLIVAVPVPGVTDQVTVASVASSGRTTAPICKVPPSTAIVVSSSAPETVIEVTATASIALALEIPETPIDKVRNAISNVRKSLLTEFVGF